MLLTRCQSRAFELYYGLGLSDREIGRRFGVGTKAITMRRSRARQRLRASKRLSAAQRDRYARLLATGAKPMKLKPIQLSLCPGL